MTMHHSPVAILQKQRQYRASSLSQQHPGLGTSAGTPNSLTSSFIDHAFDHPTPTSFSQLQFLSSSVASDGGADYTHRVPRVEEKFCSGFNCCGLELDDLHHLLEHFEECHVLPGGGPTDVNAAVQASLSANNAAFDSASSTAGDNDMPEFDDFDEEEAEAARNTAEASASTSSSVSASGVSTGTGPMLSAPPSPALSSKSDNHAASANIPGSLFKDRMRLGSSSSSSPAFPNFSRRNGKSRSPPSGGEGNNNNNNDDAVSMTSEDEHNTSTHLPFSRRMRQQSVDSLASVSTNGSSSSKKRSYNAAMGTTPHMDLNTIRSHSRNRSGLSTPDSSHPGTPANEMAQMDVLGTGCLAPSLLYPFNNRVSSPEEEMTTDDDEEEEEEEDDDDDGHSMGYDQEEEYDRENSENINSFAATTAAAAAVPASSYYSYQQMQPLVMQQTAMVEENLVPESKRKKTTGGSVKKANKQRYDPSIDNAAAAMFSPLSLLAGRGNGSASNIPVPTIASSTSPNSQASASAATLAAIQAAAANSSFPDASTPTGRVWVPNNAKPFKCPIIGCDKAYKQQNGLKYHRLHGHCNSNATGKEEELEKEEDKPFGCYVGPACGKKYKNMNGLRYHYQHSGAHGQIGLQMLSNGTHPPPAYPPGHKRSGNGKHNTGLGPEFSANGASTVVMNQSTAEALLAAISNSGVSNLQQGGSAGGSNAGSRGNSRPATPRIGTPNISRNASPARNRQMDEFDASWD